jgi:hypothetical protein
MTTQGPKAPAAEPSRIARLHPAVIVGSAAVVTAAVVGVLVLTGGGSSQTGATGAPSSTPSEPTVVTQSPLPPNEAREWMEATLKDFNAFKGVLVAFETTAKTWRAGQATDAQEASNLGRAVPAFLETRALLAKRAPFAKAPRALADYRQTVTLYVQAARVALAATKVPAGPLHDQLELGYARLQLLADRVFDQANVELAPYLPPVADVDGVVISKPAEVPEWTSIGLAPGPPLSSTQKPTAKRDYVKDRPSQPFTGWSAAVTAAGIPSASALGGAISSGTADTLGALSMAYQNAADALFAEPDPKGERVVSTRVQLSLLADAEAARAAEAAFFAPAGAKPILMSVARTLALVGDDLWDSRLGARSTGFDARLLTT